jgi:hypothetical protein
MTDDELRQAHQRWTELTAALEGKRTPEEMMERVFLTRALIKEARFRGATKGADEARARAPEGTQVGLDIEGAIAHLLRVRADQ